jgi:hypothetical protein
VLTVAVVALWLACGRAASGSPSCRWRRSPRSRSWSPAVWAGLARLRAPRSTGSVRPARLFTTPRATVELQLTNVGRCRPRRCGSTTRCPPCSPTRPGACCRRCGRRARHPVRYTLRGRQRGRFALGPLRSGCATRSGSWPAPRVLGDHALTVYPRLAAAEGLPLGGRPPPDGEGRPRPSQRRGARQRPRVRPRRRPAPCTGPRPPTAASSWSARHESPRTRRGVLLDVRADRHHGSGPDRRASSWPCRPRPRHDLPPRRRGRQVTLLDRPVTRRPAALPWQEWLERLAAIGPGPCVDLGGLLQQLGRRAAGDGALIAVLTVQDPAELRALVRAGTRVLEPSRACSSTRPASAGRARAREGAATAAALRPPAGASTCRRGDRLDDRWRSSLLHRRRPRGVAR